MDRRKFVARLLADRGGMMVITGIGSATYDVAACGDDPLNFYIWSAMGSTAMVGLGLALARPDRRVAVITGDGDMLMGLGSLATIGVKQPKNLTVIVLDNGHNRARSSLLALRFVFMAHPAQRRTRLRSSARSIESSHTCITMRSNCRTDRPSFSHSCVKARKRQSCNCLPSRPTNPKHAHKNGRYSPAERNSVDT
jgi:Thiamine pyrophosphate enzyme, C-terminal TPP binding domain